MEHYPTATKMAEMEGWQHWALAKTRRTESSRCCCCCCCCAHPHTALEDPLVMAGDLTRGGQCLLTTMYTHNVSGCTPEPLISFTTVAPMNSMKRQEDKLALSSTTNLHKHYESEVLLHVIYPEDTQTNVQSTQEQCTGSTAAPTRAFLVTARRTESQGLSSARQLNKL